MNETHRDFLVTYDPTFFEEHSESTEFEESIPSITPNNSNQFLLTKKNKIVKKKQKHNLNQKNYIGYEYKKHKNRYLGKTVQTSTILERRNGTIELADKYTCGNKFFNQGNLNYMQNKSIIRHKVIPCLSSMFGRSVSKLPKENQLKNACKDISCQVEISNEAQRHRKKLEGRKKYIIDRVHHLEGEKERSKPFGATENTHTISQNNSKSLRRVYSSIVCNVALTENETEKIKSRKYKKLLQSELMNVYSKPKSNKNMKNYCQQFPSKKSLYHVFNTSRQSHYCVPKTVRQRLNNTLNSDMSITSSGFWDYFLDKFNKKSNSRKQNQSKQSDRKDFALQCCPIKRQDTSSDEIEDDCPCSSTNISYSRDTYRDTPNFDTSPLPEKRKKTDSKNVQCECYPQRRQATDPKQYLPTSVPAPEKCGCQHSHDKMARALANKYNGEILCIHNPPCILINGCLNLTQPTENPSVDAWPVTNKKESFFKGFKKTKKMKRKQDQLSQYHAQCVEVRQCQIPEKKTEKIIQSICNHNPPCEVVRCCHKPKYDPKLQNSCVHVPMCPKVPECQMQRSRENKILGLCEHKPKCPEVPMCTRKYMALTVNDSIGTQVKPQTKMFCRHDPPCILIPKCLGGAVQETYISYESIPNCVHQPHCDLIPACCRKPTKGMVSTCCQYPNGCRVV